MNRTATLLFFVLHTVFTFSQTDTGISGKVLDSKTQKTLQNVVVSVQNTSLTQLTNSKGEFIIEKTPLGKQLILFKSVGYKDQLISVEIIPDVTIDLVIIMEQDQSVERQLSLIAITDTELSDDNSGSENTSIL